MIERAISVAAEIKASSQQAYLPDSKVEMNLATQQTKIGAQVGSELLKTELELSSTGQPTVKFKNKHYVTKVTTHGNSLEVAAEIVDDFRIPGWDIKMKATLAFIFTVVGRPMAALAVVTCFGLLVAGKKLSTEIVRLLEIVFNTTRAIQIPTPMFLTLPPDLLREQVFNPRVPTQS